MRSKFFLFTKEKKKTNVFFAAEDVFRLFRGEKRSHGGTFFQEHLGGTQRDLYEGVKKEEGARILQ